MRFFQVMTFFATMLLATNLVAGPQSGAGAEERERGKPKAACEKQNQQCMKQCDKEKRMWFFKGEAYETCAEKCEARQQSCMSTGRGMPAGGEADERRETRREDADERREEMREAAEKRRDEARAAAEDQREEEAEAEAEKDDDGGKSRSQSRSKGKGIKR